MVPGALPLLPPLSLDIMSAVEGTFAGTYFWKAEFEEGFKEGGDPPPPFPPPALAVSPAAATASSFVEAEGVWYFEAVPLMLLELSLDTGSSTAVLPVSSSTLLLILTSLGFQLLASNHVRGRGCRPVQDLSL